MKAKRVWWGVAIIMGLVLLAAIGCLRLFSPWESEIATATISGHKRDSWYTGFPVSTHMVGQ